MTALDIQADVLLWQARVSSLHLLARTGYSQSDLSAYLEVPIKFERAKYPPEILGDLKTIGIELIGSFNATLDGNPATMGLSGSSGAQPAVANSVALSSQAMTTIGYNFVYLSGPSRTSSTLPTCIRIMRTTDWCLTPAEYRKIFPLDLSMGTHPRYLNV